MGARQRRGPGGVVHGRRVLRPLHPRRAERHCPAVGVLETYLDRRDLTLVPDRGGACAPEDLRSVLGPDVACVIYQQPNFLGVIENSRGIHAMAHEVGALVVACCDPIALALIEPPGRSGADIVVGEGQPLGIPPSLGGPALGFFACRQSLVRRMPGRLAAETVDARGRRGFVLECPVAAATVCARGVAAGILPGVDLGQFRPEWNRLLLVAVTEQRSAEEIDRWAELLRDAGAAA